MAYQVIYAGELVDGATAELTIQGLVERFGFTEERAAKLIIQKHAILQRGLDHRKARAFRSALKKVGLVANVVEEQTALYQPPMDGGRNTTSKPSLPPPQEANLSLPFRFTGSAGEYFRIWIVNVLLTILTLGIYSAWAKVRTNRYFYGNTWVADSSFEYLADPVTILKGRLLAIAVLAVYVLTAQLYPLVEPLFMLALFLVSPWIIVRALAFRNRNTAYRNIRFGFDGAYGGGFQTFVLWPIAGVLSLGLLIPHALHMQKRFIVQNSRYGTSPFGFKASSGQFYVVFLLFFLILVAGALVAGATFVPLALELQDLAVASASMSGAASNAANLPPQLAESLAAYSVGMILVFLVTYLIAFAFFNAKIGNLVYNSANLARHGFDSGLSPLRLAGIYISNWLAIILSLGLARPWAAIRLARYRAETLTLLAGEGLESFLASAQEHSGAAGEEIGEVLDLNIGV